MAHAPTPMQGLQAGAAASKRFTFIGGKDGEGPESITLFGIEFPKGKPVEVKNPAAIVKLSANSHFKQPEGTVMATREEFAEAVLEELVSEDSHQAANAADTELVLRRYDRKLINLIDEDYADWIGSGDIPDGAMTGLVKVMAYECRKPFGADIGREMYEEGLADLRIFMRQRALYEPVRVDYF